jgi:hypothetical protein
MKDRRWACATVLFLFSPPWFFRKQIKINFPQFYQLFFSFLNMPSSSHVLLNTNCKLKKGEFFFNFRFTPRHLKVLFFWQQTRLSWRAFLRNFSWLAFILICGRTAEQRQSFQRGKSLNLSGGKIFLRFSFFPSLAIKLLLKD